MSRFLLWALLATSSLVLVSPSVRGQETAATPQSSPAAIQQYRVAAKYQKLEQYDLAAKEWEKLAADFPNDPLAASGQHYAGVCQFQLGQYDAAVRNFQQFVGDHPSHELLESTLTNLGLAHYNLATRSEGDQANRRYEQAIAAFDMQRQKFPDGEQAEQSDFYRGESLYALGKLSEAAQEYEAWLAKHGDEESTLKPKVQLALGSTLQELGKPAEAIVILNQLAESKPSADMAAEAALRLGEALAATDKFAEAAKQFATAAATEGFADADYALHGQATALFRGGDFAAAADTYASVSQRFPQSRLAAESVELAGKSYYQAKNYAQAAELLGKAYNNSDHHAELAHWLCRTLMELGQPDKALAVADNLLASKQDPLVLLDRADALYASEGRQGDSLAAYIAAADAAEGQAAAEARHLAAATAIELQNYKVAIEQSQQLLAAHPDSTYATDALETLAEAQLQSGDAGAAVATYRKLLATDSPPQPTNAAQRAAWSLRLAWALSSEGDEQAIVQVLTPVVDRLAGDELSQANFLLGRALFRTGDHAAALPRLTEVASASPASNWSAEAALLLARSQAGSDDLAAAIATLDKLIASGPEASLAPRAYFRRGQFHDAQENLDSARGDYAKLAGDWPDHPFAPYASYRLGEIDYDAQQYESALQHLKQAAGHARSTPALQEKATHMVAWCQYKLENYPAAAKAFEQQLANHADGPLAADARWMVGESLFAAGEHAAALQAYKQAQQAGDAPENLSALALLHAGQAAGQIENWKESVAWLERAIANHPDFAGRPEAEYELGWALSKLGKQAEAMPLMQKVAGENSVLGARAQFMVGEFQFANKKYEDAVRTFFQVAYGYGDREAPEGFHPWQSESLFEAARCLEQLDRKSAADKLYAELIERFPAQPKAELARNRLQQ